ncbi:hypothetical protein BT69DRAFT_1275885 [Atractiella rhizophila]|nr:hypothetical protein BT69DRAFT_1275885 [Atractiella rhizophila]
MGVIFSTIASIISAIGRGIASLFRIIADVIISIVNAITSFFVTIFACLGDALCCRCGSRRRAGGRRRRAVA